MALDIDTEESLYQMIESKSRISNFGNGRGVRNVFDEVLEVMNERLVGQNAEGIKLSAKDYEIIRKEDIQKVACRKTDSDKTLDELLEELNSLTGLQSAKTKIQEMIDDVQVKKYIQDMGINQINEHGTLHLVFKGNAGTGKTTVARLLGKIYKKIGILSKDIFIETSRKELVGKYMGHTAAAVIDKVKEAEGGILFIDEAYTLCQGEKDEFGYEAISTLVAELENRRDNLMVIVAGYSDEMDKFLDVNQGLASRLATEIIFEDYTLEEMVSIFFSMAKNKGLNVSYDLIDIIRDRIDKENIAKKDFGNARGVRNLVEQVERKKNSRIALLIRNGSKVTTEEVVSLIADDFL